MLCESYFEYEMRSGGEVLKIDSGLRSYSKM